MKILIKIINLEFNIEEAEKFYVERINIFGNTLLRKCNSKSIMIDEGDPFSEIL